MKDAYIKKILAEHLKWINVERNGKRADLSGSCLYGADLYGANFGVNLCGADLSEAYLYGADLPPEFVSKIFPLACPESGAFIGWKKAIVGDGDLEEEVIVKLRISEDARRSSAFGRKCRCDKAVVLAIESLDGGTSFEWAISKYDRIFHYCVGSTVSVENFDTDRTHECSSGIHFFITRQEAVDYCM